MFRLRIDYRKFIKSLIVKFLQETDAYILLVPHTFGSPMNINSDPDACLDVMRRVGSEIERLTVLSGKNNQSELKYIIGNCSFFVGSRMHACIASLSQMIPTIGVAYSRKFIGVFNSIGAGHAVADARIMSEEEIIHLCLETFKKGKIINEKLQGRVRSAEMRIETEFKAILDSSKTRLNN
jgi:polysaccharide pyruvyl transferase WcaK-like protein